MKMKLTVASIAVWVAATLTGSAWMDRTSTGNDLGGGTYIAAHLTNAIAIGPGVGNTTNETGAASVWASGACQIGPGSNSTPNSIKFRGSFLATTNVAPWSAANLLAGTSITAINGRAITNIDAANVSGTLPAITGTTIQVTGAVTLRSTENVAGAATFSNTVAIVGVETLTAIPVLNAAAGTPGTVTGLLTNGVTAMGTSPVWIPLTSNGTNYWVPAFHQ